MFEDEESEMDTALDTTPRKKLKSIIESSKDASGDLSETVESEVSEYLERTDDSSDFEEALKEKPKRRNRNCNEKKSWVLCYYEDLSKNSAKCKICEKEIARSYFSTTGMHFHLRTIHQITEPPKDSMTEHSVQQNFVQSSESCEQPTEVKLADNIKGIKKSVDDDNPPYINIKQRSSWVWRHFQYLSSSKATCNFCAKIISRGDCSTSGMNKHLRLHGITAGNSADENLQSFIKATTESPDVKFGRPHLSTSGIRNHVKLVHANTEPQRVTEHQANTKQRSSYVWRHFQLISPTTVKCNICARILQRSNGSTSTMLKHLRTHGIHYTSDTPMTQIEFKSVPRPPQFIGYSKDNCYVCNVKLGSFKSELSTVTSTTETSLHEILENFTGAELSQTEIDESSVCQKCFTSLEKYDDLLHQSQEISNNLTALLHKTHSEEVFIKEEPVFDDEVIQESSSQSFPENHPRRSLSESRDYVENEDMDEDSSDYNDDEVFNSETKADEVDKIDKADKMKVDEDIKANGVAECSTCKATFKHSKNYFRHIQIHKPKDESLFCKTCKLSFKTKFNFQIHIATDHDRGTGPFDCPVCLKTFAEKKSLKVHFYIHTKEETLLCWQCGATFLQKYSLEMHMMMHDDRRPYECSYSGCTKKFRTSGKLNIHIRVHTKEKIYECSLCPDRRYAQKMGLDLHVKKQHNFETIPRVACKICGVKVISKSKMNIHMRNIHGETSIAGDNDGIDIMEEF